MHAGASGDHTLNVIYKKNRIHTELSKQISVSGDLGRKTYFVYTDMLYLQCVLLVGMFTETDKHFPESLVRRVSRLAGNGNLRKLYELSQMRCTLSVGASC